jgi:hypothetical protein
MVEIRGGKGLIRSRGALLGEEEGEGVLIFLKGGGGVLDAGGLNGSFDPPELEALDGPIEKGGEGGRELRGKW